MVGQQVAFGGLKGTLTDSQSLDADHRPCVGGQTDSGVAEVDIALRVRDWTGTYVEHCHNTQHEDHAMLVRWDSQTADHTSWVRTPYPTWSGANYDAEGVTTLIPTAITGSTKTDAKTGLTSSAVANSFKFTPGWGLRSSDVPASSVPVP